MSKVLPLAELAKRLDRHRFYLKETGEQPGVVLCNGCFDALHLGHVRHLQAARKLGSMLLVTVTQDAHVNKGPGRPLFGQEERAEMLAALACVDLVCINSPVPGEAIRLLRPSVYCKGKDTLANPGAGFDEELRAVAEVGGRMEYTEQPETHTTDLVERLWPSTPPCKGWIGKDGGKPCELCGWPAVAHGGLR